MVFESIISSKEAEKKPWEIFFYAIFITSVSLWLANYIFPSAASVVFIFLITIASAYLIYNVLRDEEETDEIIGDRINLSFYEHHGRIIEIYSFMFLGVLVASAFWYSVLPAGYLGVMFSEQKSTVDALGAFNSDFGFWMILINNLRVVFLSFVLSLFFATGTMFILSWNASVIAVFIGKMARETAATLSHPMGSFYAFAQALPAGLLSISIHGIPEIAAYVIASISGGILSMSIIRKKRERVIFKDSAALLFLALMILVAAAFLEVYVTPRI